MPYRLEAKGYQIHHVLSIPPLAPGETRKLELFAARASVRGRVLSPAGEAVARTSVTLQYPDPEPPEETDGGGGGMRRWDYGQADGSYAIVGCPPGSARLEASAPGFARVVIEVTVPEEGELVQDLVLGPGKQLCGMVTDERGTPVPGVEVEAAGHTATSDAMGRFCLQGLGDEEVAIQVKKSGWFKPGAPWISAAPRVEIFA